jgi:hypothetical protein
LKNTRRFYRRQYETRRSEKWYRLETRRVGLNFPTIRQPSRLKAIRDCRIFDYAYHRRLCGRRWKQKVLATRLVGNCWKGGGSFGLVRGERGSKNEKKKFDINRHKIPLKGGGQRYIPQNQPNKRWDLQLRFNCGEFLETLNKTLSLEFCRSEMASESRALLTSWLSISITRSPTWRAPVFSAKPPTTSMQ